MKNNQNQIITTREMKFIKWAPHYKCIKNLDYKFDEKGVTIIHK